MYKKYLVTGGAMYGTVKKPADEKRKPRPDSPYAEHKLIAEKKLRFLSKNSGSEYVILRPANVYGPRQYKGVKYKGGEGTVVGTFLNNIINSKKSVIYGDGSQTRDYVYVDDVVNAVLLSLSNRATGVFNIGIGKEVSLFDLIREIEKATNKKFEFEYKEGRPGEVRRSVLNIKKANQVLGWYPKVKLNQGIMKMINWPEGM